MVASQLEPPAGDQDTWGVLYRARGSDEVPEGRPTFTGDVFTGVSVARPRAAPKNRTVMILQHPCAMRPDGIRLAESLLVAQVRPFGVLGPGMWGTNGKLMPLPCLMPELVSNRRDQAAFFDDTFHVHPDELQTRIACLSPRGLNLLLQRWVYHSSRVIVPTHDFDTATAPVYEEADIIEDWCNEVANKHPGVGTSIAGAEAAAWLSQADGGRVRRTALQDPQFRGAIRRAARDASRAWTPPPGAAAATEAEGSA